MRVLITGATGMLGSALVSEMRKAHEVVGVGSKQCDIRDEDAVRATVCEHRPEMIIHAAAYTDVDGCECRPGYALAVNGRGTYNLAKSAREMDAPVLYVSTDYVFDGTKRSTYCEDDTPSPLNAYGRSKLEGELAVRAMTSRHFIVRTSWLFGARGRNFVETILSRATRDDILRVVDDQSGSPTYTRHLAAKLSELVTTRAYGTYHITNSGSCSWYKFAREILTLSGIRSVKVAPITWEESNRRARRPTNSTLENRRLLALGLQALPSWQEGLRAYLSELPACESRKGGDRHAVAAN